MSDIELDHAGDYNIDEVDDMPKYVDEIDGVYECKLSLSRESGERNDKPHDNIIFTFVIVEEKEAKKDHDVQPDDLVGIRFSLLKSPKDEEEKRKESVGLRLAKPFLKQLETALETTNSLAAIIANSQDVSCTATFATRTTKGKDRDGNIQEYKNIQLKRLIVA